MCCGRPDAGSARQAQRGRNYPCPVRRKSFKNHRLQIINHQSSIINPKGFTLIELLVVISIIVLLVALLMPALSRVRKQAKGVTCRAQLHQWGILWATYTAENDGRLARSADPPREPGDPWWGGWGWGYWGRGRAESERQKKSQWYQANKKILFCPMATKPANSTGEGHEEGGTFLAWGTGVNPSDPLYGYGSYGVNGWVHGGLLDDDDPDRKSVWSTTDVKNAAAIPVLLDSAFPWTFLYGRLKEATPPPEFDAVPTYRSSGSSNPSCINRHDGYVNGLLLDWSVRKVGLKEHWTFKWTRQYNTRGPWTKAGGAKPEDWPAWMRGFKDY